MSFPTEWNGSFRDSIGLYGNSCFAIQPAFRFTAMFLGTYLSRKVRYWCIVVDWYRNCMQVWTCKFENCSRATALRENGCLGH